MKSYEFRLQDILYTDADRKAFATALRFHKPGYTGRFRVLDEGTRYVKLLVEYQTAWCAAELWIYSKDGQAFPEQLSLTSAELSAIRDWPIPQQD